jgi:uncharacterized protein
MHSNPALIQPIDSIPPLAPINVLVTEVGQILNTKGDSMIVKIAWTNDISKPENQDVFGYRVFRSFNKNDQASQITNFEDIKNTFYQDTIATVTYGAEKEYGIAVPHYSLNSKIFYQVRAIDNRENQGPLSVKVFIRRPDKVPLPALVFKGYAVSDTGINLNWDNYSQVKETFVDFDFKEHRLYRALIPQAKRDSIVNHKNLVFNWQSIKQFSDTLLNKYMDTAVLKDSLYAYCIISIDSSNNQSLSAPLIVQYKKISNLYSATDISNLTAVKFTDNKYVELNWTHTSDKVVEYTLYRSQGVNSTISQYKSISSFDKTYQDFDVKKGIYYKYGIIANYEDGTHSGLKTVNIDIPL